MLKLKGAEPPLVRVEDEAFQEDLRGLNRASWRKGRVISEFRPGRRRIQVVLPDDDFPLPPKHVAIPRAHHGGAVQLQRKQGHKHEHHSLAKLDTSMASPVGEPIHDFGASPLHYKLPLMTIMVGVLIARGAACLPRRDRLVELWGDSYYAPAYLKGRERAYNLTPADLEGARYEIQQYR